MDIKNITGKSQKKRGEETMKNWYSISTLNESEKNLIRGKCIIDNIPFEISEECEYFHIEMYMDKKQVKDMQSFINLIFL